MNYKERVKKKPTMYAQILASLIIYLLSRRLSFDKNEDAPGAVCVPRGPFLFLCPSLATTRLNHCSSLVLSLSSHQNLSPL